VVGSARLDTLDPEEESAEMSQSSTQPQPEPATRPATRPATPPGDAPLRPAAFFDLDKTLIATSAATAFARPFLLGGLLSRRAMLRSAGAQIAFLLGSATEGRTERVRAQLSAMVAGWDVAQVSSIVAANLREAVDAVLYAEALDLVARHHAAGEDVVVVSASSEELVRPIADLVGADQVIASRMGVAEGRYTGEIAFYAYGPAKAEAMRELARQEGYDLAASSAYTDSATDAPMLRAVGHGYVVNPDRALRRLAVQEGWTPVLFRRRVLVRRLGTTRSARVTVAVGAGLLTAALLVVTLARRRR
jgi:HAD superfamily hydrolase (TIGR01490 family)